MFWFIHSRFFCASSENFINKCYLLVVLVRISFLKKKTGKFCAFIGLLWKIWTVCQLSLFLEKVCCFSSFITTCALHFHVKISWVYLCRCTDFWEKKLREKMNHSQNRFVFFSKTDQHSYISFSLTFIIFYHISTWVEKSCNQRVRFLEIYLLDSNKIRKLHDFEFENFFHGIIANLL